VHGAIAYLISEFYDTANEIFAGFKGLSLPGNQGLSASSLWRNQSVARSIQLPMSDPSTGRIP